MKKLFIIAFVFLASAGFSQQEGAWSFGLQWGFQGNSSKFAGGMEEAHARFQHNTYGSGAFDFIVRYDACKHLMITSGIGFSSYGFEYAFSNNYSLLNDEEGFRYSTIRSDFSSVTLPLMVHYKFKPNCKNNKWVLGLGFAHQLNDDNISGAAFVEGTEGSFNGNYLSSESVSKEGRNTQFCFSVAREKLFKRGSMLNVSMLCNWGFNEIARSSVTYVLEGEKFNHEFSNNGNFVGFRMAYYFRSFKTCGAPK